MDGWFGGHLRAMDEPVLPNLPERDPAAQVYRMLILPTFDHPHAVRLTIDAAGQGRWRAIILDGQGGYDPGNILHEKEGQLSVDGVGQILTQIAAIDFWNLPADLGRAKQIVSHPGPGPGETTEEIVTCFDGTQLVLEGVKAGQYHLTNHSCDGPLEDLAAAFFDLAGFDPDIIRY